jgi:hypothetical protein
MYTWLSLFFLPRGAEVAMAFLALLFPPLTPLHPFPTLVTESVSSSLPHLPYLEAN